jgi:hypothetical protein
MKKYIIILIMAFATFKGYSQDISGSWTWEESDKSFVIELEQLSANSLSGFHSGVFQNGNRIDASYDEKSVFLTKVSTNIFEGTIKSSYSLSTHKVRVTFNPSEKSIEWCLYEVGSGQFYIPRKVKMFRIGDD